ncbi:UbiA prenyltransferase family-domain-containing protein [Xylariaceae sp. AK1471]|nr:UbiA prenyltransferase family-domain-containing protein [Xylariaceae sp. AK1471]
MKSSSTVACTAQSTARERQTVTCSANSPQSNLGIPQERDEENGKDTSILKNVREFIWNLWLFTESDFFTFVGPDSAFGIFGALAGSLLLNNGDHPYKVLARAPLVVLYNWGNLLIFDLANQRSPESAEEDRINKPHRPLPSERMTSLQARRLLLVALPVVLTINYLLGPWKETALLFTLTWMYNDLGGGDEDFLVRNLIIGFAFGLYNAGSLKIAGGKNCSINKTGITWTSILSAVIFTTMHSQDMKDQRGDRTRGRRTAPIVLGDFVARGTIAVPIAVWSVVCPWFWYLGFEGYLLTVPLGAYIIWLLYTDKSFEGDRKSWKLWTLWTALLYLLPTAKHFTSMGSWVL